MSSIFELLGLDERDLRWQDLAVCQTMAPARGEDDMFFEGYERSTSTAKMVDDMCLSCPVMKQCLLDGITNGDSGVRGAIYLADGKPKERSNAHKTENIWNQIKERVGYSV